MKLTIYTTKVCPNCVLAKEFMTANGIKYEEKDAVQFIDHILQATGKKQVPLIEFRHNLKGHLYLLGWDETQFRRMFME